MTAANARWFESEPFWTRMFPFMFSEASFMLAAENVGRIEQLVRFRAQSVLDVACGPGRYAIPFAKTGAAVCGVDRSEFLLGKAKERAASEDAAIEWVEADMGEFVRPSAFDLALNLFTSFGYFDDAAENRQVLSQVFSSLKPGGVFLLDHLGKELLAARLQPTRSEVLPDGQLLIQRTSVIDDWSRVDAEWILIESGVASTFRFRHWVYSAVELRDLLVSVGFEDVALFGSLDGTPYDPLAQRQVAVARRPRP